MAEQPHNPPAPALRDNCFKALKCLYIAVEESVADDVNAKVKAYIESLEQPTLKGEG